MKPKPFCWLNHFTVPVLILGNPFYNKVMLARAHGARCRICSFRKEEVSLARRVFGARPSLWPSIDKGLYGRFGRELQAGSRKKMSQSLLPALQAQPIA